LNADLFSGLFRLWGHSREEDGNGLTVYRPQGFPFPLSRGRDWIEFRPDGTAVFSGAGPDDRNRSVVGAWSRAGDRSLQISRGPGAAPQRLTIVECNDTVLKVRSE
jgi:hypothetical protein